jgi:hypothetical protein
MDQLLVVMAEQVLPVQFQELLLFMLVVAVVLAIV